MAVTIIIALVVIVMIAHNGTPALNDTNINIYCPYFPANSRFAFVLCWNRVIGGERRRVTPIYPIFKDEITSILNPNKGNWIFYGDLFRSPDAEADSLGTSFHFLFSFIIAAEFLDSKVQKTAMFPYKEQVFVTVVASTKILKIMSWKASQQIALLSIQLLNYEQKHPTF